LQYRNVCIEAVAHVLPSRVVPSTELETRLAGTLKRIGLPPGQLERLSGVRERRYWDAGTRPSTVSAMAAEKVMAKAGWRPQDVDGLINSSVSRDYLEPATSALIAGELKLGHRLISFDVTNACVGFLNGMHLLANLIELGQVERGLVVCAETVTEGCEATLDRLASPTATAQDFRDNFATLTLGCGAAAFAMCHRSVSRSGHSLYGAVIRNAPEHNQLCLGSYHEMKADAHGLLVHGVGLAVETWPYAVAELGWEDPSAVDVVVGHQVSLAHFQSIFQKIGQPVEKALLTLPYLGNCGPTSVPLTLSLGVQQGQVRPGQNVCLWAVGSGLSCAIMGVRW
jgi:3-oxoacyl-[acyl-carrier-protein] synthase III